jgi:hypothetical protein
MKEEVPDNIIFSLQKKSNTRRYEVSNEDLVIIQHTGTGGIIGSNRSNWTATIMNYRIPQ